MGWYLPISSIARPSRLVRASATTMRYCGLRILPRRLSLIFTATGGSSPGCRTGEARSARVGCGAGASDGRHAQGERAPRGGVRSPSVPERPRRERETIAVASTVSRREQVLSSSGSSKESIGRGLRGAGGLGPARLAAARSCSTRLAGLPLPRLGFLPCLACLAGLAAARPMPAPPMPAASRASPACRRPPIDAIILRASSNRSTSAVDVGDLGARAAGDAGPPRAVEDLRVLPLRRASSTG